jgi:hypothetical protein
MWSKSGIVGVPIAATIADVGIVLIDIAVIVATTTGVAAIGTGTIRAHTTGAAGVAWSSDRCGSARKP